MVHTETDIIADHINHHINDHFIDHHHIIHHQSIIYNILNLLNFFNEKKLWSPFYHYNDFEDDYVDEGMFYGRQRRFANLNPNRRGEFSNHNRRDRFSNSIHDKRGGYSILMSLRSLLLMRILMLSQAYFGLIKLIIYLTWHVFPWKILSNLWLINLKEG